MAKHLKTFLIANALYIRQFMFKASRNTLKQKMIEINREGKCDMTSNKSINQEFVERFASAARFLETNAEDKENLTKGIDHYKASIDIIMYVCS